MSCHLHHLQVDVCVLAVRIHLLFRATAQGGGPAVFSGVLSLAMTTCSCRQLMLDLLDLYAGTPGYPSMSKRL